MSHHQGHGGGEGGGQQGGKVDLSRANREELQRLPGIGDDMADRILKAREGGGMRSLEDLKKVEGLGENTIRNLEEHVHFSGSGGGGGNSSGGGNR